MDCWGLVAVVYQHRLAISLPSYSEAYASIAERQEIAAALVKGHAGWPWHRVDEPAEFDVIVFRRAGIESHLGIVVSPGAMLHVEESRESCIVRYDDSPWRGRLAGAFRHVEMMR